MSSFVGDDAFQVHHVAHDGIFACNPHPAMDLPGFPGNLQGHVDPGAEAVARLFEALSR